MQPDPPSGSPDGRSPRSGHHRADRTPRARRVVVAVAALVVLTGAVTACGTSGRALRDPKPGVTAPPRKNPSASSTTSGAAIGTTPVAGLSLTSTAWSPGGEIPRGYTCDGGDVSPPLVIAGTPTDTVELVLVVTDPDAAGFVHWIVAGIPPGVPTFPQGGLPAGAVEAPNSSGGTAWVGPCPPAGDPHTYDFTVYALPVASGLGATSTQDDLDAAVVQATSQSAMTGTYARS